MTIPDPDLDESNLEENGAPTLLTVLRVLVQDARTLAEAEAGFVKAAVGFVLGRVKIIAVALVLALFFLFFLLMALVVGLLLALSPIIGAWAATGVVAGGLALLAVISVLVAVRGVRRIITVVFRGAA